VGDIAERIGRAWGWDENRLLGIRMAGELHDVGKISIPLDILNKPGKLSRLEHQFIQEHVSNCYDLIKEIDFPFPIANIIYQHHERIDGSGYPNKTKGEDILVEAKVIAVSDVLEAMTNYRPYREALGLNAALEELRNGSGTRYDPSVVDTVCRLVNENNGKPFWVN
jgi:HD-GYP domain-containing protein (c-di-GMP phosphodiesterase class II)